MFHVIPVLKMSVHASYFHRATERVRHFYNRITLYRTRIMFLQAHIEGKDPCPYASLPTDTESHDCFAWVLMTGPKANQNSSIT